MSNTPLPEASHTTPVKFGCDGLWYRSDQMKEYAAAVSAAKDARIKVLEDVLRLALAELDELPVWSNTGHICNAARAALGEFK